MRLLIAEDDGFFRKVLEQILRPNYEVIATKDGAEAWAALQAVDAPQLAILDWVMPNMSGPQVCRSVRQSLRLRSSMYLIILTARNTTADLVSGLRAGADDYVTKPFIPDELRARVAIGERVLTLTKCFKEESAKVNEIVRRERRLQEVLMSIACRPRITYLSGTGTSP